MQIDPNYLNTAVLAVLAWAIRMLYSHVTNAITSHQTAVNDLTTRLAIIETELKHLAQTDPRRAAARRHTDP